MSGPPPPGSAARDTSLGGHPVAADLGVTGILYFVCLAVAMTGMVVLDRRFRLFFWSDARRAAVVLVAGVAFFLVWDLVGIGAGVFFRGETEFMTGLQVAPELPAEEIVFLTLLCYLTMNLVGSRRALTGGRGRR